MKKYFAILLLFILFGSGPAELPNDIRWVTASKEYTALCTQVYQSAWQVLAPKLRAESGNWAIIMDLDETVLNNSPYQVDIFEKGETFNMESWAAWVNKGVAGLVPGAGAFIDSVHSVPGAKIVYISNRMAVRTEITKKNMMDRGIYEGSSDYFLLRIDRPDSKPVRMQEVLEGTGRMAGVGPLKVLAYFGDAMGDFPDEGQNHAWGLQNFILPNPMYGKW